MAVDSNKVLTNKPSLLDEILETKHDFFFIYVTILLRNSLYSIHYP